MKNFDGVVYQTSVTKCFPGRREGSSSDRQPSTREMDNCRPFLVRQLEILRPKLLVCLGGLSWRAFLAMKESAEPGYCLREIGISSPNAVKVPNVVGRRFLWRSTLVLPMIHPSGTANGARAEYPEHDRASKVLLRELLVEIGAHAR